MRFRRTFGLERRLRRRDPREPPAAASRLVRPVAACFLALVLAGCGYEHARTESAVGSARAAGLGATAVTKPSRACTSRVVRLATVRTAYAAIARRRLAVVARPAGPVIERLPQLDADRYPTVFGVFAVRRDAGCAARWYRVQLPTLPNGSTGWIRAADVRLFKIDSRIVVDLTERRLRAYRNGKKVLEAEVAVGASETPTPTGSFYVDERFVLDTPSGPFGPAVLGISAHSDVLRDWAQGGPIALHGTDEPGLIGAAASHGCVRLANGVMRRLFALAPAGTPVVIHA
jgi:L,D-transpeptidase catalytic domain